MTSESHDLDAADARTLAVRLSETVNQIDPDDLSALAKMHGWSQSLAQVCAESSERNAELLGDQAKGIATALESLILGEAEDATAAFNQIIASVAELTAACGVEGGEGASVVEEGAAAPSASDAEQAAPETQDTDEVEGSDAPIDFPPLEDASEEAPPEPEPASSPECSSDDAEPTGATPNESDDGQDTGPAEAPPYESEPLLLKANELDFVQGFTEEAGEHLEAIEAAVLEVERTPEDTGKIDDLFRPFHTIKGMAGFLNLRDIGGLTHEVETLLDQGRKGQRSVTPGLIDVVFDVVDILKVQIAAVSGWCANPTEEAIPQPPVAAMVDKLRAIVSGRIDPEGRQPTGGSPDGTVGENLVAQGVVGKEVVDVALDKQQNDGGDKKVGEVLVEMEAATTRQVDQALRAQTGGAKAAGDQSIRIETLKLDALIDMVGELVIAQTLVNTNDRIVTYPKLNKDVGQVSKIVRDVQEVAMSMRMIPIGPTFQKMARLVRDVSRKAGKQVTLTISGEDTELDKTVIQQIGDPLVHMVRNAVDHGVETPASRRAAGKPEVGEVRLSASHQGGNIVIDIADDGNGLDPEKLIAKAIDKGIVQPGEEIDEQQAYHLVFAPGFSTAQEVTDISGRGVGMDVVKRNIDQLRGRVEISSEKGVGTTFSIRLPLTLAIIDGMVIRVGTERFVLPTISIEQSLRPLPNQITSVQHAGEVLNVRGRLIPLIQLGSLFGLRGRLDPCEVMVIIAQCEGRSVGLVVEELIGQQQVVIKTLGQRFKELQGICGAAILGDGRVGLILDTPGLAIENETRLRAAERDGSWRTDEPTPEPEESSSPDGEPEASEIDADQVVVATNQ